MRPPVGTHGALGGRQAGAADADPVLPAAASVQELRHHGGKLPGVRKVPVGRGSLDGVQQHREFGLEPGPSGRAGMEPEQPEQPGGLGRELTIGPGEHRPGICRCIRPAEGVQASPRRRELVGEGGQREKAGWATARAATTASASGGRAHDAMTSATARGSAATRSVPIRRASSSSASAALGRSSGDELGALGGDQAGEPIAAGHHHGAPRRGEQRPDLAGVAGVVKDDQDPPVAEQAPVQRGLRFQADRDALGRNLKGLQEPPHRLGRCQRCSCRIRAGSRTAARRGTGRPSGVPRSPRACSCLLPPCPRSP